MIPTLSVTLVVRDEEENLPDALASVERLADQIVVLDTGSVDRTLDIIREHPTAELLSCEFDGFGAVKQRALEACRCEWVLSLDADERISPELADRIRRLGASGELDRMGAYKIRRRNWVLGRALKTMGMADNAPLRLFRREGASFNARPVHEGVLPDPTRPRGRIEEPIEHYTFSGIDDYLRKIDHYTTLEQNENPRAHRGWHLVTVWPSTFWRYYIGKSGWRDGWPGLLWSGLTATGKFIRDMKIWIADLDEKRGKDCSPPRS